MKRAVAVGATVIALVVGAASEASADDKGNHGPPWELTYEGNAVHPDVASGQEWGEHNSSAAPEYMQDPFGPGISPGVHLQKDNGPDN